MHHICHKQVVEEGFSLVDINLAFRIKLNHLLNMDEQWPLTAFVHAYFNPMADCDSSLCLMMSIYMRLLGCPVVVNENDIATYRYNFAYWLMTGTLGY